MAYNTKAIKTDVNTKPIPQYYNPATDEYEALQGENGAARHVLYGSDGNPISTDFATQTSTHLLTTAKIVRLRKACVLSLYQPMNNSQEQRLLMSQNSHCR